jgi:hypothetical protein
MGDTSDTTSTTDNSTGSDSTDADIKSSQNTNQDDENTSGGDNNDAGGDNSDGKTGGTVSQADYDALMRRMQAADRAKTAAEKKLSDADKAKLDDVERAKVEAQEAKDRADKAEAGLRDEKIFNAFLSVKDVSWHDVSDAFAMFKLNYMDGVGVNDGKVTGIDPAIKKMAKEKAYLVKPATDGGGDTGSAHNGNRKGEQNDTSRQARVARFPAAYRG